MSNATFTHMPGDRYKVCGKDIRGKRFTIKTDNPHYALAINLWHGNVWQIRNDQPTLIKRVTP